MAEDVKDLSRDLMDKLKKGTSLNPKEGGVIIKLLQDMTDNLQKAQSSMKDLSKTSELSFEDITESVKKANITDIFKSWVHAGSVTSDGLMDAFKSLGGLDFLAGPAKKAKAAVDEQMAKIAALDEELADAMKAEASGGTTSVSKRLENEIKLQEERCKGNKSCDAEILNSKKKELESIKKGGDASKSALDTSNKTKRSVKEITEEREKEVLKLDELNGKAEKSLQFLRDTMDVIADAFERFKELDSEAESFRNNTGLVRDQMVELETSCREVNQELVSQGVSIKDAYRAAEKLTEKFSSALFVTKEQVSAVSMMSKNLGVSEEIGSGFFQSMQNIGGLTDKQVKGMAGLAANAAKAAGVPINKVMGDVANASEETYTMMRGNVRQMTLAAVQARMMGTDLNKTASAARGLLNFTESIDNEMEASVLLGKNLNLSTARQLSFQGDIAGAQKEVVRQVRSMGDFSKMNVLQQEALAKASGYNVKELSQMIKNEEKLSSLTKEQRKLYEDATKALKEQKEETGEQVLQQAQMQSAMGQLNNTFKAFKQIAADVLTPVVMVAIKLLIPAVKMVLFLFNLILIPVKAFSGALYKLWNDWKMDEKVQKISDYFDALNAKVEKWAQNLIPVGAILLRINSAISFVFRLFGGKFNMVEKIFKATSWIINTIVNKIASIGNGVKNFILKPFTAVGDMIKAVFKPITNIGNKLKTVFKPIKSIGGLFGKLGAGAGKFTSILGNASKFASMLGAAGKAIPLVGEVLMIIQAVWGIFSKLFKGGNLFDAIGETLFEIFVEPFQMLFGYLAKLPYVGKYMQPVLEFFSKFKETLKSVTDTLKSVWNVIKAIFTGKGIGDAWEKLKSSFLKMSKSYADVMIYIPKLIWNGFVSVFTKMGNWISGFFGAKSGGGGGGIFGSILSGVKSLLGFLIDIILYIPKKIWNGFVSVFTKMGNWISGFFGAKSGGGGGGGIFGSILSGVKSLLGFLIDIILYIPKKIWDAVTGIFTKIKKWLSSFSLFGMIFGGAGAAFGTVWGGLKSIAGTAWNGIKNIASKAWDGIKDIAGETWTGIKDIASSTWGAVKDMAGKTWSFAKDTASSAWEGTKNIASSAWGGITNFASSIFGTKEENDRNLAMIANAAKSMWEGTKNLADGAWSYAKDKASGFWKSTTEMGGAAWDGIKSVGNSVLDGAKNAWSGIKSAGSGLIEGASGLLGKAWSGITSFGGFFGGSKSPLEPEKKSEIKDNEIKREELRVDPILEVVSKINEKLDELIDLMATGGIAVNLDGRKVSEQLAIASF